MRADREIGADAWLDPHLAACETCALGREAMAEAGASYRAWAPIAVLEALRRDRSLAAGRPAGTCRRAARERGGGRRRTC